MNHRVVHKRLQEMNKNLAILEDFHTFQAQVLAYLNQKNSAAHGHA